MGHIHAAGEQLLALVSDVLDLSRIESGEMVLESVAFEPQAEEDPFRAALIRLKVREGLWREVTRGVSFVTEGFFRASMPIPATAPIGNYDVEVMVLSGNALVARRNASFEVVKTGFEERVTTLSQNRALLYGLTIAALSLGFGWLATVIFRRD